MPTTLNLARLALSNVTRRNSPIESRDEQSLHSATKIYGHRARSTETVLLHLCICAILLPVAAQALLGFIAVIHFLVRRGIPRLASAWQVDDQSLLHGLWRRFMWGLAAVWVVLAVGLLAEVLRLGITTPGSGNAAMQHMRLIGKSGIYGSCIIAAFLFAGLHKRRADARSPLIRVRWILMFSLLYALYMLGQRYYGLDWVHGWEARLGSNRFAYGVYRGSGLMGHPLTLAYNAMIFCLLSFSQGLWLWARQRREAYGWLGLAASLLAILVMSGSRFPIGIVCVLVALGLLLHLRWHTRLKLRWISLAGLGAAALGFALIALIDANFYGRLQELWIANVQWEQRFDRVIFWIIHWQIFLAYPWFGTGFAHYQAILLETYQQSGFSDLANKYNAHNIYLQTLAELGMLGFVALVIFLTNYLRLAWSIVRHWRHLALFLLVLGTISGGLMQNVLRDSEFLFATWFGTGLALSWLLEHKSPLKQ